MIKQTNASSLFEQPNPELELIFQSLPDLLIRITPDGLILNCYGSIDDSLPFSAEDLVGKNFKESVPEELQVRLQAEIDKIHSGAEYSVLDFSLPSTNGIRYFEARTIPQLGREEITVLIRDITEQKLVELELRKNEERYRLISTVASDYMYSTSLDSNGNLVLNWVTGAFTKITGYTFDEYIAVGGWVSRVYPDDRETDRRDMDKLSHNWPVVSEIRTVTKQGSVVWVRSYAHPVWDQAQNKLIGIYGAVHDITAEKEAEEALTLSLADLYPEEEKQNIRKLVPLLKGYQNVGEWHHIKKDGSVSIIVACSHDIEYEGVPARVAVITDVTERKLAEDRIKRLNIELEKRVQDRTARLQAMNDELEAFSYSVSHDLRAPLRGMSGYTHFLREDYGKLLPSEGLELLDQVDHSVKWMDNLIHGLLKLSRFGRQPCERREVFPAQIAVDAWESLAGEPGNSAFQFHIDNLPACQADPLLLKQVYINLLSNAVKYSKQVSEPMIRVGCTDEKTRTVYWVKDNGVGFDMKYAHEIFEAFHRVPDMEKIEGHGVGLSIVQRIIARHGGEIWAESQPGRGATFFFTLPSTGAEKA